MHKHKAFSLNNNGWCEIDHDKFKAVICVNNKLHIDIYNSDFYKNKSNEYWPEVQRINYISLTEDSYLECFKTLYFHNILRFPEFTPRQLKEALIFLCNVLEYCMENNYFLPTHLWNLTFYRCKPILIGIRDFQELSENCECQFPNWENIPNGYKICHNCDKKCKNHNIYNIFYHIISNNLENNTGKHISKFFTNYEEFINLLKNKRDLNIKKIRNSILKFELINYDPLNYYSKFNNIHEHWCSWEDRA